MFSLADLFPSFAERFVGIPEMQEGLIRIAWNHCVGERISKVTKFIRFRDGVITVCAQQSEWKMTLVGLKSDILIRMNRYLRQDLIFDLRIETE